MKQENKKQVLIIDASKMFREYLSEKLQEENITVDTAEGHRDAFTKLLSLLPDLIIIDVKDSINDIMEFLQKKAKDPNAVHIPVIISGPAIQKELAATLVKFGVVKYFSKPIKFDLFFDSIGKIFHSLFSMDTTPCILEIHLNKNIIFVEIAQGMNRDKLSLLKYKLTEIMDKNRLDEPKVIIMLTTLSLSFVDGANLELLFDNVLADGRIKRENVKVLSLDSFAKELIEGHSEYSGIEVVSNLSQVLNSVVEGGTATTIEDLINDQILSNTDKSTDGAVEMRFFADNENIDSSKENNSSNEINSTQNQFSSITIAIIDENADTRQFISSTFEKIGMKVLSFSKTTDFIEQLGSKKIDLVILDVFMNGISGLEVLSLLSGRTPKIPAIIYSSLAQKDLIVQALSRGAKSYLIKPQKPEVLIQKALEVINERN